MNQKSHTWPLRVEQSAPPCVSSFRYFPSKYCESF